MEVLTLILTISHRAANYNVVYTLCAANQKQKEFFTAEGKNGFT